MSNIFSMSGTGNPAPGGTPTQTAALDNLIRRELKVSDPRNPAQVAEALLARYQSDPRSQAIAQEAAGAPFLQSTVPQLAPVASTSSSTKEWEQAVSDIDGDLQELTINSLLRDELPEIKGWALAIHSILEQGIDAARMALDTHQRDKAFSMRRQLYDLARMVRLVGVSKRTKPFASNYRSLAQSLDEAASVLLVVMGEAIASAGYFNGQALPQTPYMELQARRDELLQQLRNLSGALQENRHASGEMPRGLEAYRNLLEALATGGQADLRSLLVESELRRASDELIQCAADGSTDGARSLASSTYLGLNRFRRLLAVGNSVGAQPQLLAFLKALQLFIDGFDVGGGARLLLVARPSLLFYGLYGGALTDTVSRRLPRLVQLRCELAEALDKHSGDEHAREDRLIRGDILLWSLDRAIDYYALGRPGNPALEHRAALVALMFSISTLSPDADAIGKQIIEQLHARKWIDNKCAAKATCTQLADEMRYLAATEYGWDKLVRTMAPVALAGLEHEHGSAFQLYQSLVHDYRFVLDDGEFEWRDVDVAVPPTPDDSQHKFVDRYLALNPASVSASGNPAQKT